MALDPAAVLKPATSVRDQHLLPGGPKRVLALDGGGVRGLITLGILQRVEDLLASQLRSEDRTSFRLAHYFDLIGGTSTGSIIAASLAIGHTVEQVRQSYLTFAPKIFKESDRQGFFKPKFDKAAIDAELRTQFEDHTLDSPSLITGLAICTKRMDTGSPWVLFNHPGGEYWDKDKNSDFLLRDEFVNAKVVITECTFFEDEHRDRAKIGKHIHVDDLRPLLEVWKAKDVVITHVSRRTLIPFARERIEAIAGAERAQNVHLLMDHRSNRARHESQVAAVEIAAGNAPSADAAHVETDAAPTETDA
jgi:hypothetical protein